MTGYLPQFRFCHTGGVLPIHTNAPLKHIEAETKCRHFPDYILKCISLYENVWISSISLKFVPKCLINNIPALVQIMAWRRQGDRPLSEPMMVRLRTHIYVTRPQWVWCLFGFCGFQWFPATVFEQTTSFKMADEKSWTFVFYDWLVQYGAYRVILSE